ncbi:oxysterol-binding protein-related protein 9-like [Arapaima gigas]
MDLRDDEGRSSLPRSSPLQTNLCAKMASIMEGPLSKWTNVMKGWQYRWFVLDYNAGLLSYYTSKDKMMRGSRRGCVRLRGAVIGIDDEDDSTFTITVDQKTFHFQARDADEREKWIHALEGTILRHTLKLQSLRFAFFLAEDMKRCGPQDLQSSPRGALTTSLQVARVTGGNQLNE